MSRKKTIDSLDSLLWLARFTRESGVSWSRGYTIDRKILEFAQKYRVINSREIRNILKLLTNAKKREKELTNKAAQLLKIPSGSNWRMLTAYDSIIFPVAYENEKQISYLDEMTQLIKVNNEVKDVHCALKDAISAATEATSAICVWLDSLYHSGKLEKRIMDYKSLLTEKQRSTYIGKELLANLIEPSKTEVIDTIGEAPALTMGEREALQFLFCKADCMSDEEKLIKHEFLLEGKEEDVKKNGLLVVFEAQDALKQGYGEEVSFSGYHYEKLAESLHSLLEKKRKLLIKKRSGFLELTISFIDKLEMKFTPTDATEGKKYIAARIPIDVLNHHGSYISFPPNHFAILRNTPPKTIPDKTETRFFDILYNERPFKKEQPRAVRRKKDELLIMIGDKSIVDHCNQARLADRIENTYARKAINIGLLKSFGIDSNREGEEIYVIEYEDHDNLQLLIKRKKEPETCARF